MSSRTLSNKTQSLVVQRSERMPPTPNVVAIGAWVSPLLGSIQSGTNPKILAPMFEGSEVASLLNGPLIEMFELVGNGILLVGAIYDEKDEEDTPDNGSGGGTQPPPPEVDPLVRRCPLYGVQNSVSVYKN